MALIFDLAIRPRWDQETEGKTTFWRCTNCRKTKDIGFHGPTSTHERYRPGGEG
jgi:hypothetical protein